MRFHAIGFAAAAALLLLAGSPAGAVDECEATLDTTYMGEDVITDSEYVDHVFKVDVRTGEKCAKVNFVLEVVEVYPDGEKRTKAKRFTIKVSSSDTKSRKVKYRLHRKTVVDSHKFDLTGCTPCGSPG